ncbi:ATP-dependent zinc metalloprotease FtsH domain protein [Mycobacterium xenopi 3993]|nr:ATP-dependent zinc metalloprotease FtsH domain protein [Mycobacterium xenopi 3993]
MNSKNAQVSTVVNQGNILGSLLIYVLPLLLLVGLFMMFSRMQGGARMGFGFGKSRAKQLSKDMPKTTFADVAGVDEAVEELYEIKDFLQNPGGIRHWGPRSQGRVALRPPGTGKTLLARASRARPGCRSSRSPAPTSSRCSSVWGLASARPVRPGQAKQPVHHLRRRDRRGRTPARRRPRRRP